MKIVIFSGSFYPNVHPRAFRATELAKEFVRNGHQVTSVICKEAEDFDYDAYKKATSIEVLRLNVFKGNRVAEVASKKKTLLFRLERYLIEYLLCGGLFKYGRDISRKLSGLSCLKDADLVIALSTPFPCHYGFAKYTAKEGRRFVSIADSGDPFYYSKQTKRAIWFKYIEKWVYKQFDYLTIPTKNAIPLYSPLIAEEKIKIIPQGFNMRNLKLYDGAFVEPMHIAYAGVFYWDIRNPEFLFKAMEEIDKEFIFHLFMRYKDTKYEEVIQNYPRLKGRIRVSYNVPHDDLIYELSKMDFLINIENLSNTQMPSKLIDYGMTRRPIYSTNEINFNPQDLDKFFNKDYEGAYHVNVEDYNIEKIAREFLELAKAKSNQN